MGPSLARVGVIVLMLVMAVLISPPAALAADNRSSAPPVHLPLRHGPARAGSAISSGAPQGYIPCDVQRAYHLDILHAAHTTGAGQLIAIVDALDNPNAAADLHAFDAAFGLPDPAFQVVNHALPGSAINQSWDH